MMLDPKSEVYIIAPKIKIIDREGNETEVEIPLKTKIKVFPRILDRDHSIGRNANLLDIIDSIKKRMRVHDFFKVEYLVFRRNSKDPLIYSFGHDFKLHEVLNIDWLKGEVSRKEELTDITLSEVMERDWVLSEVCPLKEALQKEKDQAYWERNQLVAYLSMMYPSSLERHDENDKEWDDDWRWIVFIKFLGKELSWHVHDSELKYFNHIPEERRDKKIFTWDGHTKEEKYRYIRKLTRREIRYIL